MQRAERDTAFSEFYAARVRALRRVAYVITRDWHAAEDVTQRAFVKIYRAWPRIERHVSFDYMKAHATASTPLGGAFWDGGAETFVHKGTNGRWRDLLTGEDIDAYERRAEAELGSDCAHWLATGRMPATARLGRADPIG